MNSSMVAAAGWPSPLPLPSDQWRARCSLILVSNIKFVNFDSLTSSQVFTPKRYRSEIPLKSGGAKICHEPALVTSFCKPDCRPSNSLILRCSSNSGNNDAEATELDGKKLISPSSVGVESLLTTICDTTSIAEFKMELAGFQLYVKRDLVEKSMPSLVQSQLSVQPSIANQIVESNGSAGTSLAISETKASSSSIQRIVDTASDEGLVILQSPKVGLFRRSRTIKGKKAPPSCKEKQQVKEGQILCYIEQLGGEIPIEADVSGEVMKILRNDGEPVGYADALIAILPSLSWNQEASVG